MQKSNKEKSNSKRGKDADEVARESMAAPPDMPRLGCL